MFWSLGEGAAVLLRGLDPVDGIDHMQKIRSQKTLKEKDLCNGPSKLCQALKISKDKFNKVDLTTSDELWLEDGESLAEEKIVTSARINIDYAEEWADKPLRFYILGNKSVSKRDKSAEVSLTESRWQLWDFLNLRHFLLRVYTLYMCTVYVYSYHILQNSVINRWLLNLTVIAELETNLHL